MQKPSFKVLLAIAAVVLAIVVVVAIRGCAHSSKKASTAVVRKLPGAISKIDIAGHKFAISTPNETTGKDDETSISTNDDTKVLLGGTESSLSVLKEGDWATVSIVGTVATKIEVTAGKSMAALTLDNVKHLRVTITAVDVSNKTVTVTIPAEEGADPSFVLATDAKTRILVDGNTAAFLDLSPQQIVLLTTANKVASIIEVAPTRHHAVPPLRALPVQLTKIDLATKTLTVAISRGEEDKAEERSFAVNDKSVVLVDGNAADLAALNAGQTALLSTVDRTATRIEVRSQSSAQTPGQNAGQAHATFRGLQVRVTKIDQEKKTLTVAMRTEDSEETKSFSVDDKTEILIAGKPAKLADIQLGGTIILTAADGAAMKIVIWGPKAVALKILRGNIVKVNADSNTLTLSVLTGDEDHTTQQEVAVVTDANTAVILGGKPATLADLVVNQPVMVNVLEGVATKIQGAAPPAVTTAPAGGVGGTKEKKPTTSEIVKGKILAIDGSTKEITIKIDGTPKPKVVATNPQTIYSLNGKEAKLGDLRGNQDVVVTLAEGNAAIKIEATAAKDPPKKAILNSPLRAGRGSD